MPECPGTQWISVAMPWPRRLRALLLIRLASRCPGPGSRCAARRIAACESLKTATVFTPCFCNVSLFSIATSSASPIAHSSASKTSMRPVPRKLRRDLHSFPCLHTAAAPTRPVVSVPAGWLRIQNVVSRQVLSLTYSSLPPITVVAPISPSPIESWATQWSFTHASALGDGKQ